MIMMVVVIVVVRAIATVSGNGDVRRPCDDDAWHT